MKDLIIIPFKTAHGELLPALNIFLSSHHRNPSLPKWRIELANGGFLFAEFNDGEDSLRLVDGWDRFRADADIMSELLRIVATYRAKKMCPAPTY